MGLPGIKIANAVTVHAADRDCCSRGRNPLELSLGFFDSLRAARNMLFLRSPVLCGQRILFCRFGGFPANDIDDDRDYDDQTLYHLLRPLLYAQQIQAVGDDADDEYAN